MSCVSCGFKKPTLQTACCRQPYCNQNCLIANLQQHDLECIGTDYSQDVGTWWSQLNYYINADEYRILDKVYIREEWVGGRKLRIYPVKQLVLMLVNKDQEYFRKDVTEKEKQAIQAYAFEYLGKPNRDYIHGPTNPRIEVELPTEIFLREDGKYVRALYSKENIEQARIWWDSLDYYINVDEDYPDRFSQAEYENLPRYGGKTFIYAQNLVLYFNGKTRKWYDNTSYQDLARVDLQKGLGWPDEGNVSGRVFILNPRKRYKLEGGVMRLIN